MIEKLTFLQNLALIFMVWEIIKINIIPNIIWNQVKYHWFSKNKSEKIDINLFKKNPIIQYIGFIYLAFVTILCFSQWWWVGLLLIGLSIITVIILLPMVKVNEPFSLKIFFILFIDFGFTMLLLCQIVNPLKLLK